MADDETSGKKRQHKCRSSSYRQKLKLNDPEKYKAYLLKQRQRSKRCRDELKEKVKNNDPEAIKKTNVLKEQTKERMIKFRTKNSKVPNKENDKKKPKFKVKILSNSTSKTNKTRRSITNQRAIWRESKKDYRSRLGPQKKRRIKEKDKESKRQKRLKELKKNSDKNIDELSNSNTNSFNTKKSLQNCTSRVRKALPKNPEKMTDVIVNLVKKIPNLRNKIFVPESKKKNKLDNEAQKILKPMTLGMKKAAIKVIKKYISPSNRELAKNLGINRKTVSRVVKNVCNRRTANKYVTSSIASFYKREDISRQLPNKRYATKNGPGYAMQVSIKAAYFIFIKENPTIKVGLTKFGLLRPKNVRLISMSHREFCVCVYCINIMYKLLVLNRLVSLHKKIPDEYAVLDILLCQKSDGARFHRPDCLQNKCETCQDMKATIENYFRDEIKEFKEKVVTWCHWERQPIPGTQIIRRQLITKQCKFEVFMEEFIKDIISPVQGRSFVQHIFTAKWQYRQYNSIKENLPAGCLLMVIDFAKNRQLKYQDEIKEAFYGQSMVTIHPIVMYYRNLKDQIVRDVLIIISEDTKHDYHSVKTFLDRAESHIESIGVNITKRIIFSDGCAAQYKGSCPIADLSLTKNTIDRNYYGSEHGKGESDGETGVLNRALDRAIVGRQIILQSAKQMYDWCTKNLTVEEDLSKRQYAYVSQKEINRNRPYTEVKTVKGIRKLHQLKNNPSSPYTLLSRELSCLCMSCLYTGKENNCINKEYVGKFTKTTLKRQEAQVEVVDIPEAMDFLDNSFLDGIVADVITDVDIESMFVDESVLAAEENIPDGCDTTKVVAQDSYPPGTYLSVIHGTEKLPAVVVESWPWINFFSRKNNDSWVIGETKHTIIPADVDRVLQSPSIEMLGTRLLYKFH